MNLSDYWINSKGELMQTIFKGSMLSSEAYVLGFREQFRFYPAHTWKDIESVHVYCE